MKKITSIIIILLVLTVGFVLYKNYNEKKSFNKNISVIGQNFNNGNLDQAIIDSQKLVDSSDINNKIAGLLALASSYSQKGSLEFKEVEYGMKAIEVANQVLALDDNNADAYREIGYANEIMNKFDEAIKNYNKSLELDSKNAVTYTNLGHTYDLMGNLDEAKINYEKALEINSNLDFALLNLSRVYFRQNKIDNTKNLCEKIILSSSNKRFLAEAENLLGLIKLAEKDFVGAMVSFENAIKDDPNLASAYVSLAEAKLASVGSINNSNISFQDLSQRRNNILKEVSFLIDKALLINPNLAIIYLIKGRIAALNNNLVEAVKIFKIGLSVIDTDITLGKKEKESIKILFNDTIANYSSFII